MTAPAGAATVRVETMSADGEGAPREVRIPAGRTVETELTAPAEDAEDDDAYAAVIT